MAVIYVLGVVLLHLRLAILSSFTQHFGVPNLYDFVSSAEQKRFFLKNVLMYLFHAVTMNGDWCQISKGYKSTKKV